MLDLKPAELATVRAILDAHVPGVSVWAFGSRVRGPHKPHADLDLALRTDRPLPLETMAMLEEEFAESDLPFRVDLVDWARAAPEFRQVIEGVHAELVSSPPLTLRAG